MQELCGRKEKDDMCRLKKGWMHFVCFFVFFLITIPALSSNAAEKLTDNSEYIDISTSEDLYNIRYNMEGKYRLTNDIDLEGQEWIPIGENGSLENVVPFTGVFDGCGYSINGLHIDCNNEALKSYGYDHAGLFAWNKGSIYNVNFSAVHLHFKSKRDAGGIYVGCVAGENDGIISNVTVLSGSIRGTINVFNSDVAYAYESVKSYVAGISGYSSGTIENCVNMATLETAFSFGNNEKKTLRCKCYVAGITCGTDKAIITKCGNRGRLLYDKYSYESNKSSYGISTGGTVTDCFNTAEANYGIIEKGTTINCYFTGFAIMNVNATNCFYGPYVDDREKFGWTCLDCVKMKKEDSYVGFDFYNTWEFDSDSDYEYPVLKECGYLEPVLINDDENSVERLEVTSKREFFIDGESVDRADLSVFAVYSNGTKIEINDYLMEDVDTEYGKKTLKIKYNNIFVLFEPNYIKNYPIGLKVTKAPDKTVYYEDESFDKTGMIVEVVYSDESSEIIDDYEISGFKSINSSYFVKISWNDLSTDIPVTFRRSVKEIRIDYKEMNLFEGRQAMLTVLYSPSDAYNKSVEWTSSDDSVVTVDSYGKITAIKEGTAVISACLSSDYKIVAKCNIYVIGNTAESLVISKEPLITSYTEGTPFSAKGLEVMAVRKDGSKYIVTDYKLDSVDTSPGMKVVKVWYGSLYAEFTVEYKEKTITDLKIIKNPNKTLYTKGEKFDATGMVVQATYDNSTTEVVTDYDVSDFVGSGNINAVITYKGLEAYVPVRIIGIVDKITLNSDKLSMVAGENKKIDVSVSPADVENADLVWTSSDYSTVSVDKNGLITAKKRGTAQIKVSAFGNTGVFAECEVRVSVLTGFASKKENLYDGETKVVYCTLQNKTNLTFKIDNPQIVSIKVVSGKLYVTGQLPGTTLIRAVDSTGNEVGALSITVNKTTGKFSKKSITIDRRTLLYDKSAQVEYEFSGGSSCVGFKSLNKSILEPVSVASGKCKIRVYKNGTTKLQLYNKVTNKILATQTIKVVNSIKSISFKDSSKMKIFVGDTKKKTIKEDLSDISYKPVWKSSNEKIATVTSKGVVVGKKAGTAKITVYVGKAKASYTVVVQKPGFDLTKVVVEDGKKQSVILGGLKGKKVTWKISNSKIAKIVTNNNKCVVFGKKVGVANLSAKCAGKTYKIQVKVTKSHYNFDVTGGSKVKYGNDVMILVINHSAKDLIIKRFATVVTDTGYLGGSVEMSRDVVISPGKSAFVFFESEDTRKFGPKCNLWFTYSYDGVDHLGIYSYSDTEYGWMKFIEK